MIHRIALLVAFASLGVSGPLLAGNCAGFTDIPDTSPFCADVTWIKNRGITLGCGSGSTYCPNDPVQRLQMALFLHRMGNVTFQQGGNAFGATAILGTGDNQSLDLYANGQRSAHFEPTAPNAPNVLIGYAGNGVYTGVVGATVGGGGAPGSSGSSPPDSVPGNCSLGYGCLNGVTDSFGTVSGGLGNLAGDGGGSVITSPYATVGGGLSNWAYGRASVIGGGYGNAAAGAFSSIAGGLFNRTDGDFATVAGGEQNEAAGKNSFAAGSYAKANQDGCFVFGDFLSGPVTCNTANAFVVRARGGFFFFTSGLSDGNYAGAYLAPGSNAWSTVSDRDAKERIRHVDAVDALQRLAAIPISTWNWKSQDPAIRHMGPMAQDFYAAFGLGEDEKRINTVDADGVALAAIQGLHRLLLDQASELRAVKRAMSDLTTANDALRSANAETRSANAELRAALAILMRDRMTAQGEQAH